MQTGANCFNLNFSNPGNTSALQSLILSSSSQNNQNCLLDDMEPLDSADSKESTPLMSETPTPSSNRPTLPNGKKTKGRVKIKMEYIGNKLRRYTTFSKRKTGIMKKAHELSTLTGTQVMLIVASETGHVYAFATNKLKPLISGEPGKSLIQGCLNAPDDPANDSNAVKTEFTFEPPNGGNPNGPLQNGRKRKFEVNEEMMSLPTMVSSSPPLNDYCDSDNESEEESDSRMDEEDEKPPVLQQANVDIFTKLVQDAMRRNALEQKQKQIKPQKRKSQPQQQRITNNRQKQQMDMFASILNSSGSTNNQPLDQTLLEIFAQGLNASASSGASPQVSSHCSASPSPSNLFASSSNTSNFTADSLTNGAKHARRNGRPPKLDECPSNAEPSSIEQPKILFQLPQGRVYAPSESPQSLSPAPHLLANSKTEVQSNETTELFSAAVNGSSSSTSSLSPNAPNVEDQQQLLNNLLFSGTNMQNIFDLMSRLNDSSNHK